MSERGERWGISEFLPENAQSPAHVSGLPSPQEEHIRVFQSSLWALCFLDITSNFLVKHLLTTTVITASHSCNIKQLFLTAVDTLGIQLFLKN